MQPVVKPVAKPVGKPVVSCRLYKHSTGWTLSRGCSRRGSFNNRFDNRYVAYRVNGVLEKNPMEIHTGLTGNLARKD